MSTVITSIDRRSPADRYGIKVGEKADFVLVDTDKKWVVNPETFVSKGRFTPFEGVTLYGDVLLTVCDGKTVYNNLG